MNERFNEVVAPALELSSASDCGCCEGARARTPAAVENLPNLSAITHRVGTHGQFKESMLVALSDHELPALQDLTTRDPNSFSIALLDAWATVADVLTFYQERIANESYLRTATEKKSVFELARLVGYKPKPGVAADARLAFTLEDSAVLPLTVLGGVKVQSVPGPDEKPQIFETIEDFEGRAEWNAMKLRMASRQQPFQGIKELSLQGTATGLKTGDWLLIVAGKQRGLSRVVSVKPDMEAKATYVGLNPFDPPPFEKPDAPAFAKGRSSDFAQRTLDEKAIKEIVQKTWAEDDLLEVAQLNEWPVEALTARIVAATKSMGLADDPHVIAFRQRAPLFGYNAPKPSYGIIRKCGRLVGKLFGPSPVHEWKLDDTESQTTLFLDNAYNAILPGDYIAIEKPDSPPRVLKVATVAICPRTAYGLSSKTTRLTVEEESWWVKLLPDRPTLKDFRDVTVHIQAERQTLAGTPIKDYLKPGELSVTLDRLYLGLQPGRQVILQGELSDLKGIVRSELLVVKRADVEGGFTVLTFEKGLQNGYLRNTASLNANVANATHGETVEEVLGSGDPTAAHQQFTLRRQPLTYTSAATTDGIESTLEIRVNGIQWHETKRLRNAKEHDRVFVTRVNDEGYTIVEFGDGETGARLPAGVENVQAKYRVGIGRKPRMKAGQLSQLMTRPLGVRAVTNPWPASGGDDSQSQDEVRQYAPLSLLTFGRLVALKDYEDFVRTFPGIAKANAISMTDGAPGVFITIAGADGAEVGPDTNTYLQLTAALKRFGDPRLRVKVKSCQQMTFKIEARVAVNPDFIPAQVLAAVKEKLENTFSFSARAFGQHVTSSEVIAVMQSVPGVTSLCLQKLAFTRDDTDKVKLPAAIADGKSQKAAELLTLGVTSLMEMEESR